MELPTYTNIWRIEKRLYKLYDFRLPMPLPVGQIVVFAAIAAPYVLVLALLGVPLSHTLVWLYILPPGALTWLVTRPVLEGKRLPELVTSQLRYLSEPRTWCRMAPLAEKDEIVVVGRVWRQARPLPLATVAADVPDADAEASGVAARDLMADVKTPDATMPDAAVPDAAVPDAAADPAAAGGPARKAAARSAGQARARWPQASGGLSAAAAARLARAGQPESGTGWPEPRTERPVALARLTGTGWPDLARPGVTGRPAATGKPAVTGSPAVAAARGPVTDRPAAARGPVTERPAAALATVTDRRAAAQKPVTATPAAAARPVTETPAAAANCSCDQAKSALAALICLIDTFRIDS